MLKRGLDWKAVLRKQTAVWIQPGAIHTKQTENVSRQSLSRLKSKWLIQWKTVSYKHINNPCYYDVKWKAAKLNWESKTWHPVPPGSFIVHFPFLFFCMNQSPNPELEYSATSHSLTSSSANAVSIVSEEMCQHSFRTALAIQSDLATSNLSLAPDDWISSRPLKERWNKWK